MKKILIAFMVIAFLQACGNNSGQTGVDNDGIKVLDSNGGLADTTYNVNNTAPTDTSKGENRVDLSKRDTFNR